jgi:hypothetical protein
MPHRKMGQQTRLYKAGVTPPLTATTKVKPQFAEWFICAAVVAYCRQNTSSGTFLRDTAWQKSGFYF